MADILPKNSGPVISDHDGEILAPVTFNKLPPLVPTNSVVLPVVNGEAFKAVGKPVKSGSVKSVLSGVVVNKLVNLDI